ncbi:MAG: YggU family protein [Gammaproteobacteria bacterium]|nr:YggU family protein [Gammaproteobacteria bacterium]MBU1724299.1 YggU family protein [Gammaproteobacteria bacterium]MBU2006273.1 YggU family protein [Gammaproteobacteria bacterium]
MAEFYRWEGKTLHLFIRVQPKASRDEWAEVQEDRIRVRITAPPVDGKANQHLLKFLAKAFGVAKSEIQIKSGETGRNKHVCINAPPYLPAGIGKNE